MNNVFGFSDVGVWWTVCSAWVMDEWWVRCFVSDVDVWWTVYFISNWCRSVLLVVGGGGGGMRDDSAKILFRYFLWEALVNSFGRGRDVHSLMLLIQHFLCQPGCHPPFKLPQRMSLEKLSWHVTCPNHASFISWQLPEKVPVSPQRSWTCSAPSHWSWALQWCSCVLDGVFYLHVQVRQWNQPTQSCPAFSKWVTRCAVIWKQRCSNRCRRATGVGTNECQRSVGGDTSPYDLWLHVSGR